jgi:hypothetical protein
VTEQGQDAPIKVRIRALPVPLWAKAQEQTDALLRELALIAAELGDGKDHHLPVRLITLITQVNATYGGASTVQEQQLFDAVDRGTASLDLDYVLPASVVPAALAVAALLDEADDYCREGEHLLTLAAEPDVVAFRRWFLAEFSRQADGKDPVPWPEYAGR